MGTMTSNKLGGLALTFGPLLAVLAYLLSPGQGLIGGQVDFADPQAGIGALLSNGGIAAITSTLAPIGLIILLHGINTLVEQLRTGQGGSIAGLGRVFLVFGIVAWMVGGSFQAAIAGGNTGAAAGALYAAGFGLNLTGGILSGLAFLLIGLGVSTNANFYRNFALVAAAVSLVLLVVNIVVANDTSMQLTLAPVVGIGFIVFTVWSITLGQKLGKL